MRPRLYVVQLMEANEAGTSMASRFWPVTQEIAEQIMQLLGEPEAECIGEGASLDELGKTARRVLVYAPHA